MMTALDIMHYLEQHKYKFNDEIIRRFIKQYDKHETGFSSDNIVNNYIAA